ncbi:MAG: LytTR family transcriptional regulator [Henriciella sp.]|nr:LytTR family transcriptional regulator [Henriciella sp.]
MFRALCYFFAVMLIATTADAQAPSLTFIDFDQVTICPAEIGDTSPPDFQSAGCETTVATEIDPQNTQIWVQSFVHLDATRGPKGEPLSLYISGKMASEVYLNGVFVAANGTPGADAGMEQPGKMDVELYPPQDLFNLGTNEVVLRASSHHGYLHLHRPLHLIGIAPTGLYNNPGSRRFDLSLVTLGLFLVGGLYFGVMAMIGTSRTRAASLSVICFFAGGQLLSEALRALVAYPYPIHDLRLLAIAGFSTAFGLSVAFHIFKTFSMTHVWRWIGGLAAISILVLILIPGFDFKSLLGMTVPLAGALRATGLWTYQGRPRAFVHFIALLVFLLAIAFFQGLFLDTVFFLLVAFFLLLLFVEQALLLAEEERERRGEEARANRLEQALAEAGERVETGHINVKSAGKIERIATSQIVHCSGAGGYSELVLIDGRTVLHSASLNELEATLPATFLRVHRSHLINVMFVESLTRDSSGTGTLLLSENIEVPVSRRVMPKVREALA